MGVEKYSGWTFYNECDIPQDISTVLAEQEYPVCASRPSAMPPYLPTSASSSAMRKA